METRGQKEQEPRGQRSLEELDGLGKQLGKRRSSEINAATGNGEQQWFDFDAAHPKNRISADDRLFEGGAQGGAPLHSPIILMTTRLRLCPSNSA